MFFRSTHTNVYLSKAETVAIFNDNAPFYSFLLPAATVTAGATFSSSSFFVVSCEMNDSAALG